MSAFDFDDLYALFIFVENYNNWILILTYNASPNNWSESSDQGVPIAILEFLISQCQSLSTNMLLRQARFHESVLHFNPTVACYYCNYS